MSRLDELEASRRALRALCTSILQQLEKPVQAGCWGGLINNVSALIESVPDTFEGFASAFRAPLNGPPLIINSTFIDDPRVEDIAREHPTWHSIKFLTTRCAVSGDIFHDPIWALSDEGDERMYLTYVSHDAAVESIRLVLPRWIRFLEELAENPPMLPAVQVEEPEPPEAPETKPQLPALSIDERTCIVSWRGVDCPFRPGKQFEILKMLNQRPTGWYEFEELNSKIWDGDSINDATIHSHLYALRKTLAASGLGEDRLRIESHQRRCRLTLAG